MKDQYIKELTLFQDEDLVYKYEHMEYDEQDMLILTEQWMRGQSILIVKHDWKMHAMYHRLEMLKLAYIYRGSFVIYTNGKMTKLEEGSLCIVPKNVEQKFTIDYNQTDTSQTVMINILINSGMATEIFEPLLSQKNELSDYLSHVLWGRGYPQFMILCTPSELTRDIAEVFFAECLSQKKLEQSDAVARTLLVALLSSYMRDPDHIVRFSDTISDSDSIVNRILRSIQYEFRTITLEALCERFHYTPSYICRIIKKHTGMTFKEYLTQERLNDACRELILSDRSVRNICADSGWNTVEHFYRVFHRRFGVSPIEYRETMRNKLLS